MIRVAIIINERTVTSIPMMVASWFEKNENFKVDVIEISRECSLAKKVKTLHSLQNYDVIHTNQNYSAMWVSLFYIFCLITDKKTTLIHTLHTNFHAFNRLQKAFFCVLVYFFRKVIVVNSFSTLHSIPFSKIRSEAVIIPHAVDKPVYNVARDINKRPVKLLLVGRLVPVKNYSIVLRALPLFKQMNVDVNLTICGKGPEKKRLVKLVEDYDLEKSVVFTGELPRKRIESLMKQHHFLMVPSHNEGFGVATIEAMFNGCLPICSDIAINNEVVGLEGIFFDQHSPRDLFETIKYFVDNPSKYDKTVLGLTKVTQKYKKSTCVESYEKLYKTAG